MSWIWCSHNNNSDTCQECKHESYIQQTKHGCSHCSGFGGFYPNGDKYDPCCKGFGTYDSLWVQCFICSGTGKKKT